MLQLQDISNIEKKFQDAFAGTLSLEDKVKNINELRQELKAYKRQVTKQSLEKKLKDVSIADNSSLEDKIKTIAKLNRSLRDRMNRAAKKVAKDFEKIVELNRKLKPENSSLEDKVKIIVELHRELKVQKGRKDEVKIIKKLIHNLEGRMDRAAKRIAEDFEKIAGFKQKFEGKDVFTSKKVAEFESNKKSQTTLEGKISDQNKQEKISIQTDKIRDSVSKIDTPGRAISENKNFEQEKTSVQTDKIRDSVSETNTSGRPVSEDRNFQQEKISVQTDIVTKLQPSVSKDPIKDKPSDKKPEISLKQVSVDRNATEKKSNNKKSQLSEKKNIAQPKENQKEEGFLVLFLKKIFKKLFGEDKKSVEDRKGTTQKSTSNDEGQQQNKLLSNQDQSASEGLKQIDNPLVTPVTKVEKTKTDHER
ncbi:MAG: hypothetical protein AB3P11_04095 [Wolbachia pipientis]